MNGNILINVVLIFSISSISGTNGQNVNDTLFSFEEKYDQITMKILREILRRVQYPKASVKKSCFMPNTIYSNCAEIQQAGCLYSGVYEVLLIMPNMDYNTAVVYCDMETDGGGWTLIQRRGEFGHPHVNFTRKWKDYAEGFGDITQEFWLGNENIHALTYFEDIEIRIDVQEFSGDKNYEYINFFRVSDSNKDYEMIRGDVIKTAGLGLPNRTKFVTYDRDFLNCPEGLRGGWWREGLGCELSTLNGKYPHGSKYIGTTNGMFYERWREFITLSSSEIKIRPKWFRSL